MTIYKPFIDYQHDLNLDPQQIRTDLRRLFFIAHATTDNASDNPYGYPIFTFGEILC